MYLGPMVGWLVLCGDVNLKKGGGVAPSGGSPDGRGSARYLIVFTD